MKITPTRFSLFVATTICLHCSCDWNLSYVKENVQAPPLTEELWQWLALEG